MVDYLFSKVQSKHYFFAKTLFLLLIANVLVSCTQTTLDQKILLKEANTLKVADPIVGSTFKARTEYNQEVQMKVVDIELDPEDPELYLYQIDFLDESQGKWQSLCLPDLKGVSRAIPLKGFWDDSGSYNDSPSIMTFACTAGVIAKCVRWGYKPWKTKNGISLKPYHQTCTRMTRADYCGNGKGHTRDGTTINVFDLINIQERTPDTGMVFEAAWDENGATYFSRARWFESKDDILKECPEKLSKHQQQGSSPLSIEEIKKNWPSTLLFNESYLKTDKDR